MTDTASPSSLPRFSLILGLVLAGVFTIDLLTPLGVANGVMYIAAVLISLRQRNPRLLMGVALGCTLLTILGYWLSPEGGEWWKVLWNRGLAIGAIWITAIMGRIQWHQAEPIEQRDKALQDFIHTMPSACFTFDREGTILSWNPAAECIYGYSQQEAVGASCSDLLMTPEIRQEIQQTIDAVFMGQSLQHQLWHDRNKNGEVGWRLVNLFPVLNAEGKIAYGVSMNVDVTAQKTAEEQLVVEHRLLHALIESSSDPIFAKDREGTYILVNQATANTIGLTAEEILGRKDTELFPQEFAQSLHEHDQFVLTDTESLTVEEDIPVAGQIRTFSSTKSRLNDGVGATIGIVGVSHDITDLKQAQHHLLLTELVFNASQDHLSIVDREYRYRRVNPIYEHVHGKTSAELVGMSVADLLGKEVFAAQVKPLLDRCFNGEPIHYESWFTFQGAQPHFMSVSYLPLTNPRGFIEEIVVISRDLTDRKQAEEAVEANEQRLRTILDSMINFVGIGTPDGIVLDCNQAPLLLAGLGREEVIGKPFVDTYWLNYSPAIQERVRQIIRQVAKGETIREDIRARMGEDTYITIDACYVPVKDATGRVVQIVHSGIDVTARRAAEFALKESQQKLQAILDHSPNLIFMKDKEGRYLHVNKHFEHVSRLPEASVIGHNDQDLFPPSQATQFQTHDRMVLQGNTALEFEETALHHDGVHTNLVHKFPLHDATGAIYAIGGIATDITARKRTEDALRTSEARFRKYFESGLVGMAITSLNKQFVEVNDRMCQILGYSREELRGVTWADLTHPEDLPESQAFFQKLLEGTIQTYSLENRFVRKDRSTIYTNLYVNAVRGADGKVEYFTSMIQDLTQQKEAEAATRAAEQLALAAMNALSAHICVLNEQGTILMVNDSWKSLVLANGGDPALVGVGANYFSFMPRMAGGGIPDTAQMLFHLLEVLDGERKEFSYEYSCAAPISLRWFSCRISRFEGTDPLRVVVAHQDITEQKQTEQQLREAEMFTTSIVENLPNMIFVKDAKDLRFVRVNKAGETLLGYDREDLLGKTDFDFFPNNEANFFISQDRKILNSREYLDISEEPIHTKNSGIRILHTKKLPICDSSGTPRFLLGISEDITERKIMEDQIRQHATELEAEVERRASRIQELEQRRMQVEKLAALSQVAAGVAHEINNPLASIAQSLALLTRAIPPEHPKYKYIPKMQECIDRMTRITRQLYNLYRPSGSPNDPVDVERVLKSALDIMQPVANKKGLRLTAALSSDPLHTLAGIAPSDLLQVFCNILQNAVDASSPSSDILTSSKRDDSMMTISITDHGIGIPPEILPRIFDPFFTTKYGQEGAGLGLGLAVSKHLIDSMGGSIHCSTLEEGGTTFSIIIPASPLNS